MLNVFNKEIGVNTHATLLISKTVVMVKVKVNTESLKKIVL